MPRLVLDQPLKVRRAHSEPLYGALVDDDAALDGYAVVGIREVEGTKAYGRQSR